ncbi:hypothetical protein [Winogradskyella sp.]|uniref:hypothetical protein n=1 Tax=Winogradskyella sp. TaxID=1883156 RepID=UPI002633A5E2|nr:hypothetical protein [Winogradskyella sp.]
MKQFIILSFTFLIPLLSISQDLSGKWSGEIIQNNKPYDWDMEVNIIQNGYMLSGTSVYVQNDLNCYTSYKFEGSIKENIIEIKENEVIKVQFSPESGFTGSCLKRFRGSIKVDEIDNELTIVGIWDSTNTYDAINKKFMNGKCYPGTFKLTKSRIDNQTQKIKEEQITTTDSINYETIELNKKEVKLFTKDIKIKVWDRDVEDNDSINIYLNSKVLDSNLGLSNEGKFFDIELQLGENIIEIEALNIGTNPPNTSAVGIFADQKQYIIKLSASKGERDSLKIILD